MMSEHAINQYTFELWRGDPPRFHTQTMETYTRAGVNGTAAKLTGKRGKSFNADLTSWLTSFPAARVMLQNYFALIGASPVILIHNGFRFDTLYRIKFLVEDVAEMDCQANVRLLGPGINYAGGTSLVTRWTMTPVLVT